MKKILLIALSVLMVQALSAKVYDAVSLTLDKADGIYTVGETAVVSAKSENPGEELRLQVKENGNVILDSTIVLTAEPSTVFTQLCDASKWILVKVSPKDSKDFAAVGYVVDPQNFTTALKAPADLYEYWDKQIANMRKGKMKIKEEPVETPEKYEGKVKCWHVSITMPEGRPVNGFVAVPVGAVKKTLPILLNTHGAGAIDKKGTQSSLNTAAAEAAKGCIAMDINAHGMEDGADIEYYKDLKEGELKDYQRQPLVDRESYYFRLMYLRVVRAIDYLVTKPEWDGQKIMVAGSSQGGAQSLAGGGLDPRVTHVRASVPAITNVCGWFEGYQGGWPYNSKKVAKKLDRELAESILPYFDTALLIARFKGQLFIELGFIDETCPPLATYSAYNNAVCASDKTLFTNIYRPHGKVTGANKKAWEKARKAVINPYNKTFYFKAEAD